MTLDCLGIRALFVALGIGPVELNTCSVRFMV
jgi:hypothetical protein